MKKNDPNKKIISKKKLGKILIIIKDLKIYVETVIEVNPLFLQKNRLFLKSQANYRIIFNFTIW